MSFFTQDDTTTAGPTAPEDVPGGARETDEIAEPCNRFQGRVASIENAVDGLDMTVAGSPVAAPHWQADSATDFIADDGSTHPMCIATATGSAADLMIKVEVTKADGLSGTAVLTGTIGAGATWRGTFPVAVGTHDVTVKLDNETTVLRAHRGDIVWRATVPDCGEKQMGRSHVELYRVLFTPVQPFLDPGLPVEALRFLYDQVGVAGIDVAIGSAADADLNVTARITTHLHSGHGLTYDTGGGRTFYLPGSRTGFDMTGYLAKTNGNIVNCYDQAAAVLVFAGVMGINGFTRFVEIFGFINETTLVGGIRTNNPFFATNGSDPITDEPYPTRTPFGNHQFYMDRGTSKVFDACAGPHLGTESYLEYMEASVDTSVVLPPRFPNAAAWRSEWGVDDNVHVITHLL